MSESEKAFSQKRATLSAFCKTSQFVRRCEDLLGVLLRVAGVAAVPRYRELPSVLIACSLVTTWNRPRCILRQQMTVHRAQEVQCRIEITQHVKADCNRRRRAGFIVLRWVEIGRDGLSRTLESHMKLIELQRMAGYANSVGELNDRRSSQHDRRIRENDCRMYGRRIAEWTSTGALSFT